MSEKTLVEESLTDSFRARGIHGCNVTVFKTRVEVVTHRKCDAMAAVDYFFKRSISANVVFMESMGAWVTNGVF